MEVLTSSFGDKYLVRFEENFKNFDASVEEFVSYGVSWWLRVLRTSIILSPAIRGRVNNFRLAMGKKSNIEEGSEGDCYVICCFVRKLHVCSRVCPRNRKECTRVCVFLFWVSEHASTVIRYL